MAANAAPDNSLFWCLERLSVEGNEVLSEFFETIQNQTAEEVIGVPFQPMLKCRLLLRILSNTQEVSQDTLLTLNALKELAGNGESDVAGAMPPAELLLQVKTLLIARLWRNPIAPPGVADIVHAVRAVFAGHAEAIEEERYQQLLQAGTDQHMRNQIDRATNPCMILDGVLRYVDAARDALGPTLLETINTDISMGKYIPGQANRVAAVSSAPFATGRIPQLSPASGGLFHPVAKMLQAGGPSSMPPSAQYVMPPQPMHQQSPGVLNVPPTYPTISPNRQPAPALQAVVRDLAAGTGEDPMEITLALANQACAQFTPQQWQQVVIAAQQNAAGTPGSVGLNLPMQPIVSRPTPPSLHRDASPSPKEQKEKKSKTTKTQKSPASGNDAKKDHLNCNWRPPDRARRMRWTDEEVDALIRYVAQFGAAGAWSQIKNYDAKGSRSLYNRSNVDMKDKWRSINKNEKYIPLCQQAVAEYQEQQAAKQAEDANKKEQQEKQAAVQRPNVRRTKRGRAVVEGEADATESGDEEAEAEEAEAEEENNDEEGAVAGLVNLTNGRPTGENESVPETEAQEGEEGGGDMGDAGEGEDDADSEETEEEQRSGMPARLTRSAVAEQLSPPRKTRAQSSKGKAKNAIKPKKSRK